MIFPSGQGERKRGRDISLREDRGENNGLSISGGIEMGKEKKDAGEFPFRGKKGKVSGISSSATYHGEAYSLPVMSTFGLPRTGNHNTWKSIGSS